MHHVSASIKLFSKGKSRVRALKLSIIGVIGCIEANLPIPLGIVSTGANPELVKGKIKRGNNSPVAPSADFEIVPQSTAISVNVIFISKRSTITKTQSTNPACGLKPRMGAVAIITMFEIIPRITPAPVWPINTANFETDIQRKRSMIPFVISAATFIAEY